MEREKLLAMQRKIEEVQFTAHELGLYLDTHPSDETAVLDFETANEKLRRMIREYERQVGPMFAVGQSCRSQDRWLWAEGPWPWEG